MKPPSPRSPHQMGIATLKNVASCMATMSRLIDREAGRPGLGVFHGHSGYGKTYAAIYVQNKTRAARVEVGDSWTRKVLLEKLCLELNIEARGTLAQLTDRIIATLVDDGRPLIIDEADKLCDKNMIEIVREIADLSGAAVLLIGEEKLPQKLATIERVHNRVLMWEPAQPCDLDDTATLARLLTPIEIADDLLDLVREKSGGRARRIVTNIDAIVNFCRAQGLKAIAAIDYAGERFETGSAPRPRGA